MCGEVGVWYRAAAVLGVVAVAGIAWTVLRPTEEDRIVRRLAQLAEDASLQPGESPLVRAARGARIAGYFTDDAHVELGPPFEAVDDRGALVGLTTALRLLDEGVTVTLGDVTVRFDRRLLLATGALTARATSSGGQEILGIRAYEVGLRQVEGEWLIHDLRMAASESRDGLPTPRGSSANGPFILVTVRRIVRQYAHGDQPRDQP